MDRRSLVGYSPWGRNESYQTELTHKHTHKHTQADYHSVDYSKVFGPNKDKVQLPNFA